MIQAQQLIIRLFAFTNNIHLCHEISLIIDDVNFNDPSVCMVLN